MGRWPQESFDGRQETAIGLGTPALESLGVAGYARRIDARRALGRAGAKIVSVDPAYEAVHCEKRVATPGSRNRDQLGCLDISFAENAGHTRAEVLDGSNSAVG